MKAAAPGKLVLSGAYAVLFGAPAVVTAVDRYVVADSEAPAAFITPEVRAALGDVPAPAFDASALRDGDRKLGLGSSAAILVASLAALALDRDAALTDAALAAQVFERARLAHRSAQGGGSGIDVAAAAYGGTLIAHLQGHALAIEHGSLPRTLCIEAWFSGDSSSTPDMVRSVRALAETDAAAFEELMGAQTAAAHQAVATLAAGNGAGLVAALDAQVDALHSLGQAAGVPIITPSVLALRDASRSQGGTTLASGAGGGDSVLYVGNSPPSPALVELRDDFGYRPLALRLEARGVHAITGSDCDPNLSAP